MQVLAFCWSLLLLAKIDAAAFEVNMTKSFSRYYKKSFHRQVPYKETYLFNAINVILLSKKKKKKILISMTFARGFL